MWWMPMVSFLDEASFIQLFVKEMEIPASLRVDLDSRLVEDLDFDSLQMMLTVELLAELLGEPELFGEELDLLEALDTVRGVYSYYLTRSSMPPAEDEVGEIGGSVGPVPRRGLRGALVELKPPLGQHYGKLYEIATATEVAWRWRYGGAIPSYDEFIRTFEAGVLTQLVATRLGHDEPVGLVAVYNANPMNKHAYLAAVVEPCLVGSGAGAEAVALFCGYVFDVWDFEKLYLELPEYNLKQFASGLDRYLKLEGRLGGHSWYGGRRWDQLILAIYRDDFVCWQGAPAGERSKAHVVILDKDATSQPATVVPSGERF